MLYLDRVQRNIPLANHMGVRFGHDGGGGFVDELDSTTVLQTEQAAIGDNFAVLILDAWRNGHGVLTHGRQHYC